MDLKPANVLNLFSTEPHANPDIISTREPNLVEERRVKGCLNSQSRVITGRADYPHLFSLKSASGEKFIYMAGIAVITFPPTTAVSVLCVIARFQ
ncbi:hypothetical protein TNCV_1404471 [Trichonephila clavipes]|nr:hypothetical protein TNCV_1404471 [Trichonephila clavipes]